MNIGDLTITSLDTITAFDVTSGAYKFTLDELQSATISQTQEKTDITGKGGRKLSSLKKNKAVTISGTNGLISGGLLETQTGGTFAQKDTTVMWTDYLTVNTKTTGDGGSAVTTYSAQTAYKAVGTTGSEIKAIYAKNDNGTLGAKYEQDAEASKGKFTYDPSTKTITFAENVGAEIVVFYERKISASVLENKSDSYSGKAQLYVDATAEDKCANVYHVQFYIPKADFNGEFSFEMGTDQSVHAFEAESLAGGCGTNAGANLWTYTVFGATAADVA